MIVIKNRFLGLISAQIGIQIVQIKYFVIDKQNLKHEII